MVKLDYIVLYSDNLVASERFYQALGLAWTEERHEIGPTHLSTVVSGIVIELYPAKLGGSPATGLHRIGITVEHLEDVIAALGALGSRCITSRTTSKCKSVCFLDPDGRTIEISEDVPL